MRCPGCDNKFHCCCCDDCDPPCDEVRERELQRASIERDDLRDENARILKEGENERAALVHIMLDIEEYEKQGDASAWSVLQRVKARVKEVTGPSESDSGGNDGSAK